MINFTPTTFSCSFSARFLKRRRSSWFNSHINQVLLKILHNATLVTSLQEQQSINRCVRGTQCRFLPPCSRKHLDLIFTDEAGRRDQGLLKLIVRSVSSMSTVCV